MPHEEDLVRPHGLGLSERKEVVLLAGDVPRAGVDGLDDVVGLEGHQELSRLGEPFDDQLERVKVLSVHALLGAAGCRPWGGRSRHRILQRVARPLPRLETTARLEVIPGAAGYPARHDVRDALLVRGDERIPVVVKRIRRDFRQPEGNTRAERAVRIARHLLAHGLDTPEPLGLEVTAQESVLVVRKLERAVQIRSFFLRRDEPGREAPAVRATFEEVVTALGRFARRLHDAGVFFRDFTDGNILVTEGETGPRLWLVDLDRARIRKGPLMTLNRLRDLARPGLRRPEDRRLLLEAYYAPGPVPPAVPLVHAALKRRIVLWDGLKRVLRPWRR